MKTIKRLFLHFYIYHGFYAFLFISYMVWLRGHSAMWYLVYIPSITTVILINTIKSLSFLRFLTWPQTRHHYLNKTKNPIVKFGVLTWLEFEGHQIFIKEGQFEMHKAMKKHFEDALERMNEPKTEVDGITIRLPRKQA